MFLQKPTRLQQTADKGKRVKRPIVLVILQLINGLKQS